MAKNDNQMAAKELRGRSASELQSLLAQKADELHKASFKHALGQLRTTHQMKQWKREIARINTVLAEQARTGK